MYGDINPPVRLLLQSLETVYLWLFDSGSNSGPLRTPLATSVWCVSVCVKEREGTGDRETTSDGDAEGEREKERERGGSRGSPQPTQFKWLLRESLKRNNRFQQWMA